MSNASPSFSSWCVQVEGLSILACEKDQLTLLTFQKTTSARMVGQGQVDQIEKLVAFANP